MEKQETTPKTEMFDVMSFLKEQGITEDEKKVETINPEDVIKQITKEEDEVEEVKPPTVPASVVTEEVKPTVISDYSKKLKDIIDAGFIEDAQISWGAEGEEKEVFLSELEELEEDQYKAILAKYKEAKDAELKEKYISVDGLDERTKSYIELKKAGGDPSQLIKEEIQHVNPWEKLDLEDEDVQEYIVRSSLTAQGLKPKFVDQEIAELKENLQLDTEATKVFNNVQSQFKKRIEDEKKAQLENIEKEKQESKEFRKNMSVSLKELIPNENIAKLILDNATKKDEVGLTNTDKLYFDSQKDPKLYAEVSFFLNNREEFYKSIGVKNKNKETIKTVNTLFSINPKIVKSNTPPQKDQTKGDEVLKRFTEKFNQ